MQPPPFVRVEFWPETMKSKFELHLCHLSAARMQQSKSRIAGIKSKTKTTIFLNSICRESIKFFAAVPICEKKNFSRGIHFFSTSPGKFSESGTVFSDSGSLSEKNVFPGYPEFFLFLLPDSARVWQNFSRSDSFCLVLAILVAGLWKNSKAIFFLQSLCLKKSIFGLKASYLNISGF